MRFNQYGPQMINGKMHVWIQEVGFCPAKRGSEVMIGDRLAYNHGYTARVISIDKITPKSRIISIAASNGQTYKQRIMNDGWKPIQEVTR